MELEFRPTITSSPISVLLLIVISVGQLNSVKLELLLNIDLLLNLFRQATLAQNLLLVAVQSLVLFKSQSNLVSCKFFISYYFNIFSIDKFHRTIIKFQHSVYLPHSNSIAIQFTFFCYFA